MDRAIGQVDPSKLNVNGGSIPLGHPFGATGTRLVLQALHELRARKKNLALISVCAAGGLGLVMIVEAI
jgi:acetyl-CoA acyltransferase